MNLREHRAGVVAILAVAAGLVLVLWPADVQAQEGAWKWQNPLPQGNGLDGVWGSSSDVFAVGDLGTIVHYDGTGWSAMSSGTSMYFLGVWGSSASDVFVVGYQGTILHYGG